MPCVYRKKAFFEFPDTTICRGLRFFKFIDKCRLKVVQEFSKTDSINKNAASNETAFNANQLIQELLSVFLTKSLLVEEQSNTQDGYANERAAQDHCVAYVLACCRNGGSRFCCCLSCCDRESS